MKNENKIFNVLLVSFVINCNLEYFRNEQISLWPTEFIVH